PRRQGPTHAHSTTNLRKPPHQRRIRMSRRRDEAAWQRREDAVRAIVGGATIGETAALLGVDRSTVGKWLTEPDVRALLETERRTVAEHARDQLLAVHTEAARIILRELRGA